MIGSLSNNNKTAGDKENGLPTTCFAKAAGLPFWFSIPALLAQSSTS
jgi:hypothetical protein